MNTINPKTNALKRAYADVGENYIVTDCVCAVKGEKEIRIDEVWEDSSGRWLVEGFGIIRDLAACGLDPALSNIVVFLENTNKNQLIVGKSVTLDWVLTSTLCN